MPKTYSMEEIDMEMSSSQPKTYSMEEIEAENAQYANEGMENTPANNIPNYPQEQKIDPNVNNYPQEGVNPDGSWSVGKIISDGLSQAGTDLADMVGFQGNRAGALINSGIANLNESIGVDSSLFREGQKYFQDKGKINKDNLADTYGEGLLRDVALEATNPINYTPLGQATRAGRMATLGGTIAGETAGNIALEGDRSGIDMKDVNEVALNTGAGMLAGRAIEGVADYVLKARLPKEKLVGFEGLTSKEKLKLADEFGIDTMTSDIYQPKWWGSKFARKLTERIPFTGTAKNRIKQQEQRIQAVDNYLNEVGVGKSDDMIVKVVENINNKRLADFGKYGDMKKSIFEKIEGNPINTTKALNSIREEIGRLEGVSDEIYAPIIKTLRSFEEGFANNNDIISIETLRKTLGDTLGDRNLVSAQSEVQKVTQKIYKSLNDDIGEYIGKHGEAKDFKKWKLANAKISKMIGEAENGAFKNLLKNGKASPETLRSFLNNKSSTTLKLLNKNLDSEGKKHLKSTIMSDILEKSTNKKTGELNIDNFLKFANDRDYRLKIDSVFNKADKETLNGLVEALRLTRRAETASTMHNTGDQASTVLMAGAPTYLFGGDIVSGGAMTLSIGVLGRIFESKMIRNMFIKLGEMPQHLKVPYAKSIIQNMNRMASKGMKEEKVANDLATFEGNKKYFKKIGNDRSDQKLIGNQGSNTGEQKLIGNNSEDVKLLGYDKNEYRTNDQGQKLIGNDRSGQKLIGNNTKEQGQKTIENKRSGQKLLESISDNKPKDGLDSLKKTPKKPTTKNKPLSEEKKQLIRDAEKEFEEAGIMEKNGYYDRYDVDEYARQHDLEIVLEPKKDFNARMDIEIEKEWKENPQFYKKGGKADVISFFKGKGQYEEYANAKFKK